MIKFLEFDSYGLYSFRTCANQCAKAWMDGWMDGGKEERWVNVIKRQESVNESSWLKVI